MQLMLIFNVKRFLLAVVALFIWINHASSQSQSAEELQEKAATFHYTNQDSSYFYYGKLKEFYRTSQKYEEYFWTAITEITSSGYFFDYNRYDSLLIDVKTYFEKNKTKISDPSNKLAMETYLKFYKGQYHYDLFQLGEAADTFEEIVSLQSRNSDDLSSLVQRLISNSYQFLAAIYRKEGKYALAKELLEQNQRFVQSLDGDHTSDIETINFNRGNLYHQTKQYKKSNQYLLHVFRYHRQNDYNTNYNRLSTIAGNISENYRQLGQLDSAFYYINIQEEFLPEGHSIWGNYHQTKGNLYQEQNNDSLAIAEYKQALAIVQKRWNNEPHEEVVNLHTQLASVYSTNNKRLSEHHLNQAEKLINQLQENKTISLQRTTLDYLLTKIRISFEKNEQNQALESIHRAVSLIDELRTQYKASDDFFRLLAQSKEVYSFAINVHVAQYEETKKKTHIDSVFHYMEKSKNNLLLTAIYQSKANQFGDIPDKYIQRESELKNKIAEIENKLSESQKEQTYLEEELFKSKQNYRELLELLEADYEDYYNLKYTNDVLSLARARKKLTKKEQLISYFIHENKVTVVSGSKGAKELVQVPFTDRFRQLIEDYHQASSKPGNTGPNSEVIFNQLLRPVLRPEAKKLTILPDGILNYLPFEALKQNDRYLIEDYSVSYVNSSTLLHELKGKSRKTKLLAVAPDFSTNSNKRLVSLPNSEKEANEIVTIFSGQELVGKQASKNKFTAKASDFSLLHLATHAITNDENPDRSFLAFTETPDSSDLLYVNEIYNLDLSNANMVTLSACKSGVGELKEGEGFISLARAFFYSGAPSITSTLWNINDQSAAEIMQTYYRYLADGKTKDKALQLAKIDFLHNYKETKFTQPYYWAAFTVSGNTEPVTDSFNWWWLLLLGIIPVGIYGAQKFNSAA